MVKVLPRSKRLYAPDRLRSLRRLAPLDAPPAPAFDRFTLLVSQLLRAPGALLTLVDVDRQFFVSSLGLPEPWASRRQTPLSHSLCQHIVTSGEALLVDDARLHPLFAASPATTELGVVAYAGVPLTLLDGQTVGALCAIDTRPRVWSADELVMLHELAALAAVEFGLQPERPSYRQPERRPSPPQELPAQEQAAQARDTLLSIIAHEIRAPLTLLLGNVQLMRRRVDQAAPEQRQIVEIERQAWRMNELIDTLLDAARLERGQIAAVHDPLDLCRLVREVVAERRVELTAHTLVATVPDEPLVVAGDQARLVQVLANLLGNAVKYSPGGGKVELTLFDCDGDAWLTIRDEGVGIPAEALPLLFEKFYRISSPATRGISGNGLGLYVVRELVALHKGTVSVESVPGEGSVFTVRLPLLWPS